MAECDYEYMIKYIWLENVKSHYQKYSNSLSRNFNNIPKDFFMELTN